MKFYTLPIERLDRITSEAVRLTFDISTLRDEFTFKAGQYITFKFNLKGEELHRAYSICSAPGDDVFQVAVKEVEGGRASAHINRNLQVGDIMEIMAPQGNFVLEPDTSSARHIVLFASGSGITPILSIAKMVLNNEPNSKVTLFYGNRNKANIMFYDELDELAKKGNLNVYHILSDGSIDMPLFNGRINFGKTLELLHNFAQDSLPKSYFICGPAGMMSAVNNALIDKGVSKDDIHIEFFENPGQEFQTETSEPKVAETIEEPFDGTATIEITLDDETNSFEMKGDSMNLLEAAIQSGIDPPYSCRGGVCTTCRAHMSQGQVRMDSNFALTEQELEEGYILTCQAHPLTKNIKLNFDE